MGLAARSLGLPLVLTEADSHLGVTNRLLAPLARRIFLARTVKELGPGGQRRAERELGWNRVTIRKGTHELESGFRCLDSIGNFFLRFQKSPLLNEKQVA